MRIPNDNDKDTQNEKKPRVSLALLLVSLIFYVLVLWVKVLISASNYPATYETIDYVTPFICGTVIGIAAYFAYQKEGH